MDALPTESTSHRFATRKLSATTVVCKTPTISRHMTNVGQLRQPLRKGDESVVVAVIPKITSLLEFIMIRLDVSLRHSVPPAVYRIAGTCLPECLRAGVDAVTFTHPCGAANPVRIVRGTLDAGKCGATDHALVLDGG